MSNKYNYDAIIIGAGISGLVCGCYLAKAGLKTLIVEKNAKPGGYCTSFNRGGFHFDACVHSLGSLRKGGNVRKILEELGLENRLKISRNDPSDIIITPDYKINFWNSLDKTIKEFQNYFPKESRKIKEFFYYINECEGVSFSSLRSKTFYELLNKYFEDEKLKAILSLPLLGNAGLATKKISALTGTLVYKEFMFDGGYYPNDSIQSFADIFVERFKEYGGEIYFSSRVNKINLKDKKVKGIVTEKKDVISSKYVISNSDATQTFQILIGKEFIKKDLNFKLKQLKPSLSMFILYLGTSEHFKNNKNINPNTNIWFLPYYDIDKMYNFAIKGDVDNLDWFLVRLLSNKKSLIMLVNAPFLDEEYWKNNKNRLIDVFIKKIEQIIPGLSSYIVFKEAATPHTLYKWTLNYRGAAYGWSGMPSQFAVTGFSQKTDLENFYLTGHWTTLTQGIAGVAYLGRDTSQKILNKESKE
ncbi:MAG: phytoene desaturase family protein [Candidatus Hodarchaeales archaeon]